ncbi:MAG: carbohydrate ABC transporter permease [Chloroflexi bacterium]|nr:carbohydrate ABC transporter permease [Chloroflexota bacterium]
MPDTRRVAPLARIGFYLLSALLVAVSIIPFLWMLSTSFKSSSEIYAAPRWIPLNPTLEGYIRALTTPDVARAGLNSVVVATLTTLLALVLAIGAGYGFARFQFFGRDLLAVSVLFSQLLPSAVVLIPLYLFFDRLHLIDTYPALVLSYLIIVLPLCTWMLRGYFLGLPREVEEAGLIDGCSHLGVLIRLALPLALPAIVATGLYAFTVAWDEFLFALTFTQSAATRTLPVELSFFTGEYSTDWAAVMAASVLMSIPVLVIFLAFQRYFVRGLAEGAIKG